MSAQAPPSSRIYIDTNTFVYQLINQNHWLNAKTNSFFARIVNQDFVGATSSFVRTEYLAVIKGILSRRSGTVASQNSIDIALKAFDDFLNNMGIEFYDSDELANIDGKLFEESHRRVETALPTLGGDGKWRPLNGADSLHLLFAERTSSDEFATSDQGFKGINSPVVPHILWERY